MDRRNIIVIHFQPLEFYPPIQNLLSVFQRSEFLPNIFVISTSQSTLNNYEVKVEFIKIKRININSLNRIIRLLKYCYFYLSSFYLLLKHRPSKVLYFESISAFPAIVYKLLFKKVRLFVHYHEYTTKEEYKDGMHLVRWNHFLEKKTYSKFSWISHTNNNRIQLFKNDQLGISDVILHVMPNFPLSSWQKFSTLSSVNQRERSQILKLVYVGAISIEDTYIKEIIEHVSNHPEKFELEIFSLYFPEDLFKLIKKGNVNNINYSGPINYHDIPQKLKNKDVGLILYKGNTLNYIYNAPNKLFEYLACGLDVWFPREMLGCYEYISNVNPQVLKLDFLNLKDSIEKHLITRDVKENYMNKYSAEEATSELFQLLFQ